MKTLLHVGKLTKYPATGLMGQWLKYRNEKGRFEYKFEFTYGYAVSGSKALQRITRVK